jgi:serine/threonine-protein kinase
MMPKLFSKLVVVTLLTLPIFGSAQVAKAQDTYGATAYSPTSDATAISWDHPTEKEALNAAVAACNEQTEGANDCEALTSNSNNCGALAVGKGGVGAGWGDDKPAAEAQALAGCSELEGGQCKVQLSACNN